MRTWAASADKHGIARERSEYVLNTGVRHEYTASQGSPAFLYIGWDQTAVLLEVITIDLGDDSEYVIHSKVHKP